MGFKPPILLQPRFPERNDPDVRRFLDLIATATGAPWVELELRLETGTRQRYRVGKVDGSGSTVPLETDSFGAALHVGGPIAPEPHLTELASLSLEKILLCRRFREQVALLRGALDTTTSAVLLFDTGGDIVYANPPADRLLSRQTEDSLAVETAGEEPQPLFEHLCSMVESVSSGRREQGPRTGTLAISDGSLLAFEVMVVEIGGGSPTSGVLVLLQPVPPVPALCLDAFCSRHKLSRREQEVVRLLLEGLTTTAMADRLNISPHTVRDHLKRLYRKTDTCSRGELLSLLSTSATVSGTALLRGEPDRG